MTVTPNDRRNGSLSRAEQEPDACTPSTPATLGCADGPGAGVPPPDLSHPARRRLLVVHTSDPAAKEDLPPLARMMGHTVRSVEPPGDGRLLDRRGARTMSDRADLQLHPRRGGTRARHASVRGGEHRRDRGPGCGRAVHDRRGLARHGGRHGGRRVPGLPALNDLYVEFVDNGGQVWLCGACTKPRGITEERVAKGADDRRRGQGRRGGRRRSAGRSPSPRPAGRFERGTRCRSSWTCTREWRVSRRTT